MQNNYLLTYLLFVPLVGGLLLLLINREKEHLIRWFGLGVSVIVFIISLFLYVGFDISNSDFQFVYKYLWIPNLNISYHVGIDGISLLLVLAISGIIYCQIINIIHSIGAL